MRMRIQAAYGYCKDSLNSVYFSPYGTFFANAQAYCKAIALNYTFFPPFGTPLKETSAINVLRSQNVYCITCTTRILLRRQT